MSAVRHHTLPDGTRIAYRHTPGTNPTIVFLPGYMSDMAGGKATALFEWARGAGHACLCLDYSGCGASGGDFAQGTLTKWRDEVCALIAHLGLGRVVLVGSSMGGWLMLLVALALGEQVAGLVGIAAAPDFTQWGYGAAQKAALAAGRTIHQPNPHGPEPTPTHPAFWADGQRHLLLEGGLAGAIPLACPVRLVHGQADHEVPWKTALRLAAALRSGAVQVTLVKDAGHRLSRAEDIALILRKVAALLGALASPER